MPLKFQVASLAEIPETLREHYAPKDGHYVLTLDGAHPDLATLNGRLAEFRDNNVTLIKERDTLKAEAEAARQKLAEAGKPDAKVAELEAALATERAAGAALRAAADATTLRTQVADAFLARGGRAKALNFIVGEAASVFSVKDGALVSEQFSPQRPGEKLTLDDFMLSAMTEAAFAFNPSGGGGASGSSRGNANAVNELLDPTPAQLGEHAREIRAGKLKVRYTGGV